MKSISCSLLKENKQTVPHVCAFLFFFLNFQLQRQSLFSANGFSHTCVKALGMPTLRPHLKGWKAFGTLVLCNRNISRYLHMNYALLQLFHQVKVTLRFSQLFRQGIFLEKHFSHTVFPFSGLVCLSISFFFSLPFFKLDFPISIERQFSSMSFYFSYFVSLSQLFLCINLKIAEVKQPYEVQYYGNVKYQLLAL